MKIVLRYTFSILAVIWIGQHDLVAQEIVSPTRTIRYLRGIGTGISPDGRFVVATTYYSATLYDATTGDSLRTFDDFASLVYSAAWSPDGQRLLISSIEKAIIVGTDDWGEELNLGADSVRHQYTALWSHDGSMIAFGDADSTARVWDAVTGELLYRHAFSANIRDVHFTRDKSRLLVTSADGMFYLWNFQTDELKLSIKADQEATGFWNVYGTINLQGTIIATSSGDNLLGGIKLWDAATGDSIGLLEGHTGRPFDLAFTSDGSHLVSAGYDHTARLWRMSDRTNTVVFNGHRARITDLDISADDRRIVTVSSDSTVRIWDLDVSAAPFEPVAGESDLQFRQAVPNPAHDLVALDVVMSRPGDVSVTIVNAMGQIVMEIPAERFATAGERRIVFDVGALPAGAYRCLLSAGEEREARELRIVR